jgi:hypothetical protein
MRAKFISGSHQRHKPKSLWAEITRKTVIPRGGVLSAGDNRDLASMQRYSDSMGAFISGKTLALWTTILLGAGVVFDLINVGTESLQLFLISAQPETASAALSNNETDISELPRSGLQMAVILFGGMAAVLNILLIIVTAIVFLIWEYRANSNLRPLGVPRPEYSSRWAVGSWFVPILNLFVPFKIISYIWRKSDPDDLNADGVFGEWNHSGADEFTIKAWWGFWIATSVVGRFTGQISRRADTLSEHTLSCWASILTSALSLIAALLAISIVRGVNARQEERNKRLIARSQQQFWSAGVAPPNIP